MDSDARESSDTAYFGSYGDISVHELMLKDRPRTLAYKNFTEKNKHLFINKIVLDVGAGTGILSLFAASAGAKYVYAVEASVMALACQKVIECNGFEDIISVIHGRVENIELPVKKVDIIISEWMGFYLLHESMLDSVVYARDKWLKEDGIMIPSFATLYLSPVNMDTYMEKHVKFWEDVYGYDLSPLQNTSFSNALSQPVIENIDIKEEISEPQVVTELNLAETTLEQLQHIKATLKYTIKCNSMVHGFALWFDVDLKGPIADKTMATNIVLSTSPKAPPTHWKQTVVFLPSLFSVVEGEMIACKIKLTQDDSNKRHYNINLEMVDVEEHTNEITCESEGDESDEDLEEDEEENSEEHPIPCKCGSGRCRLIIAIMEKYENEQAELENEAEFVDTNAEIEAARAMDNNEEDLGP